MISQTFATMMGGNVSVTSELGKGTTFRLLLPLLFGTAEETPAAVKTGEPAASNTVVAADAPLVLVVEDDAGSRESLTRTLTKDGWASCARRRRWADWGRRRDEGCGVVSSQPRSGVI